MTWKRQELRQGDFIALTDLEKEIVTAITYYLKTCKKTRLYHIRESCITKVYSSVWEQLKNNRVNRDKIWKCLLIMYIRGKVRITSEIRKGQRFWKVFVQYIGTT